MFGTITLSYTPPFSDPSESSLTMRFSSEADLKDVLRHFENFLRAMEYPLSNDERLTIEGSRPHHPVNLTTTVSGDTVTFFGNMGNTGKFIKDFTIGQ